MSKIFSVDQFKQWDAYTIREKPISSIDLMESAAGKCVEYMGGIFSFGESVAVFCGPGNNGGDGLAIARLLDRIVEKCTVYLTSSKKGTEEYETNLNRFKGKGKIVQLSEDEPLPEIEADILIDAIFGVGLNRPAKDFYERIIEHINKQKSNFRVFSVDVPSGMFADKRSIGNPIVFADVTMTFGSEKLAFFMPENGEYTGEVVILDIGLSDDFTPKEKTIYETIESKHAATHLKRRKQFSNKGDYGNACLIAGSYGMMGAAVLSTLGCIRSGAGKVTCYTCEKGYDIIQSCVPEAMCKVSGDKFIFNVSDLESFNAIGIGPGIGRHEDHLNLLHKTFKLNKPLVIDADALNVLSEHQDLYEEIPGESILTPHPKEFERLFGKTNDNFEERELALRMAMKYNIFIILKGRYTCIATPGGKVYINKTGNPGMATGGSGDVLTGILTGFLAQRYKPLEAALLGVYLHGLAGDLAATAWSENSMIASDITKWLGKAFLRIENCREKILNKQVE